MNHDAGSAAVCEKGAGIVNDVWLLSVFADNQFGKEDAAEIWGTTTDAAQYKLLRMTEQGFLLKHSGDRWQVRYEEPPSSLPHKAVPRHM
jgi:hypothetical protein